MKRRITLALGMTALLGLGIALTPGHAVAQQEPVKSEGMMAKAKAKTQASAARAKKNWAAAKFRKQVCTRQAAAQKVPSDNRVEFVRDCARRMAKGKSPATGPDVLPALFVSPEALKPNLGGMTATGDGGAAIDQKKK